MSPTEAVQETSRGKRSSQIVHIISELDPEHPFSCLFVLFYFIYLNYKLDSDCLPPCGCTVRKEPHSWLFGGAVLKMFHNNKASSVNGKARRLDVSRL